MLKPDKKFSTGPTIYCIQIQKPAFELKNQTCSNTSNTICNDSTKRLSGIIYHKALEVNSPLTSKDSLDDFQPSFPKRNHNLSITLPFLETIYDTPWAGQLLKDCQWWQKSCLIIWFLQFPHATTVCFSYKHHLDVVMESCCSWIWMLLTTPQNSHISMKSNPSASYLFQPP